MALLIDGYNLLNATSIFGGAGPGTALHRTRLAFLEFLASSFTKRERGKITIVFDAAGAPPGLPHTISHEGMTIYFARRHSNADEMIEELLEDWKSPRTLVVVSSDHRVQRAARRCGATFVDSDTWYAEIVTTRRQQKSQAEENAAKPAGKLPPDELAYWLREFGGSATENTDAESPFPPGYGDDIDTAE